MKRLLAQRLVWAVCLLLGVGAMTWAVLRESPAPPASATPSPEETLAAIPPAKGKAAVDQAIVRWTERLRQYPEDANGWAELGDALMQKVRETADHGYYRHAERAYVQARALDAGHVTATTGLAWVHGCRHEFEESGDWARKALALQPDNYLAYGLLGDAALELGDYEAAFDHYQKMLDIRPGLSSYSRGAHLLYLTGDVRRATWLMGKAIEAGAPYAENTAWCRAQLALIHFNTGNLLAAEQVFRDAPPGALDHHHMLAVWGKVKAARKDYPGAIECYQKASAIAPQHDVLVALGDLYRLTGKEDEAEKQYALVEAAHQVNKTNGVQGDAQMAQFYADHDRQLAEALRLAEAEYRTRRNIYVADTLAWCYLKNGRPEDAKRVIGKALSKRTPDAGILFHAGMIHAELGDRAAAQLYLSQTLSLNPHFSPVHAPVAADRLQRLGAHSADPGPGPESTPTSPRRE